MINHQMTEFIHQRSYLIILITYVITVLIYSGVLDPTAQALPLGDIKTPPFHYFFPSPFLTCCAILPTSFGGKGPHLRRLLR